MEVDTNSNFSSLFECMKLGDPWLPPRTWESITSQSGMTSHCNPPLPPLNTLSSVSEASLVRLSMNAMQGVESALISLEKIAEAFCSYPADRTYHQIPTLWNRSSSTHATGKMLKSIGCLGFLVFLLQKFTTLFTYLDMNEQSILKRHEKGFRNTLVNQAFAVAVRKVLEGYMSALDTLSKSIGLRRSSKGNTDSSLLNSSVVGCLTSVVHSEISFVEMYLHTKEMRTQIEVLGNICNLHETAFCFSSSPLTDLINKATSDFHNFYKGGNLLTYLYTKLQVADPAHCGLLKFLFIRSCEPYWEFIRSWIFKAEINDPYEEFIIEFIGDQSSYPNKAGTSVDFPLTNIRERNGVAIPCFLKDLLVPLVRAGQQLQVLVKLLDSGTYVANKDQSFEDFLPSFTDFSASHASYESGITFNKESMKSKILSRDNYYEMLQKKLENLLTRLEVKYQQIFLQDAMPNIHEQSSNAPLSIAGDDMVFSHLAADKRKSNRVVADVDSDDSSIMDEFPYLLDAYNSSECSSVSGTEEHRESEQIVESCDDPNALRQKHFSSLSNYVCSHDDNSLQQSHQCDKTSNVKTGLHIVGETTYGLNDSTRSPRDGMILSSPYLSFDTEYFDPSWNSSIQCTNDMELLFSGFGFNEFKRKTASKVGEKSQFGNVADASDTVASRIFGKNKVESELSVSNLFMLQPLELRFHKNTFSMNPMLSRNDFLKPMSKRKDLQGESFACFDFSAVKNPCDVYVGKAELKYELPFIEDSSGTISGCQSADFGEQSCGKIENLKFYQKGIDMVKDVSDGSNWGSLLCNSSKPVEDGSGNQMLSLLIFETPLDYIINKCLVEEVMLQYMYISKLTIKLLQEGFDLQDHLLALRRYHFMEIADWADLFIIHLWRYKWCVEEADRRLSEIQSFLDLSIQRSSCESDNKKDRLFVYIKEQNTMSLSKSVTAICSFEFLGLGYRVEWPLSIILTPSAMKIYADIFSFLIQVKLAVFSLSDFWSSLKDLGCLISMNRCSDMRKLEVGHFNLMMKIRHQVNHFLCTLQHYVESQLSHVSWSRFLQSLRHKVKDMMDLESIHMSYLTDSLHMCFLSEETRFVANIIKQIMQCALDFRSCLTRDIWSVGVDHGSLSDKPFAINVSKLLSIQQTFGKSVKELHTCYLRSPKHADFCRFWESLNYNHYYSHFDNEVNYSSSPV